MINPFNPGSGSKPPFLAGRDDELSLFRKLLTSITDGKNENIILTGLRGTGKTVLLDEFNKICHEKKFFPIKRSQFNSKYNDPKEFYEALKYDMSSAATMLSVKRTIKQKLGSMGSALKPKSVGVPGVFYYEPSYTRKTIPFENHLEDYLSNNWKLFEKNGYRGVMFLFDEFHQIEDDPGKRFYVLVDFIGAINELQKKGFPYHLTLAGLPKLSLNVKNARSYSERMFRTTVLENLTKNDAVLAISEPLKNSQYSFSEDLIDAVVRDTGRYPYFIQFYCKEIIDNMCKKKISLGDYQSLRPIIVKQLETSFFDPRIDTLTETEKKLLIAMAKIDTDDMLFKDIIATSGINKNSLSKYVGRLEKKGLIYNHKYGIYRFSLPMLRNYIMNRYG